MGKISNIFQLIHRKLFSPDLVHPVFGELMSDAVGSDDDIWQSDILFAPLQVEIGLTICAGLDGPGDDHVEFFRNFEADYVDDFERVEPALIDRFEEWFGQRPEFSDTFEFVAITIPKDGDRSNAWSLSFICLKDPDRHMYTAEMLGNSVVDVTVDG